MSYRYYVRTLDPETGDYTPQKGVRKGPYSLWGLRKAIRKLRGMGYDGGRQDPSVYVWSPEAEAELYKSMNKAFK